MRVLSATALAALDTGRFTQRALVKIAPVGETALCVWDDIGDIVVDGDTYTGAVGRFTLQFAPSSYDLSARAMKATFSGLDAAVLAIIESVAWHQAPILVQRAVITTEAPEVLHLMTEFAGFLDQMIPRETPGGTTTIELLCETENREMARSGARTRSDADQRTRDPDDGFFSFAASAVTTTIDWGRAPEQAPKAKGLAKLIGKIF